ncbi:MAG TPA: AlkA N-terminal domain-containing protein, partial [Pyrinomonadaceae bacterium]|nr:AlkA N-terminal domain-containing protein [Pyrinomonadaceae bacterium]
NALAVRVQIADPRTLYSIVERIRGMFDLNADWAAIAQGLGADPELTSRIGAEPGLRVPGCWSGFELTTRAILGQRISVKAANALAGKIAMSFGQRIAGADNLTHLFPTPEILAEAKLTDVGLTKTRAETIRALARAVCNDEISFERIVDAEVFLKQLREILGIDWWTAQYVAMRALGEPDAFPTGDLGLLRSLGLKTSSELEQRAEAWRPWRSYASMYFWNMATELRDCG